MWWHWLHVCRVSFEEFLLCQRWTSAAEATKEAAAQRTMPQISSLNKRGVRLAHPSNHLKKHYYYNVLYRNNITPTFWGLDFPPPWNHFWNDSGVVWNAHPLKSFLQHRLKTPWDHFSGDYPPPPKIISATVLTPQNHFWKMILYVMYYFPKNSSKGPKSNQKKCEMISWGW